MERASSSIAGDDQATVARYPPFRTLVWFALAGLAVGLAGSIRLAGISLIAVGVLFFLLQRKWWWLCVFLVTAGVSLSPWHIFNIVHAQTKDLNAGSAMAYVGLVQSADLYDPSSITLRLSDYVGRLSYNARYYFSGFGEYVFHQPWRRLPDQPLDLFAGKLDVAIAFFIACIAAIAALVRIRHRHWLLLLYSLITFGVLLVWPFVQQRYFLPPIPVLWFYLLSGLAWLVQQTQGSRRQIATAAVVTFFMLSAGYLLSMNVVSGIDVFRDRHAMDAHAFYQSRNAEMANYFEAGQWLESHTDKETVIITRKPYLTYLYNDRVAEPFLWTNDEKAWIPFMEDNGINYIVEDAFTWPDVTDRFLRPVLRAQSSAFELVFETSPPVTRVWRYHSID